MKEMENMKQEAGELFLFSPYISVMFHYQIFTICLHLENGQSLNLY